jgi:hypothetical protein
MARPAGDLEMSKENKNANEMDSVDQHLEEISKMYDKVTIWQRLKILSVGLRSPRSTKEYKEAMIELQRLSAPAAAVLLPVIAVVLLAVMSAGSASKDKVIETQVIEAEQLKDLDEVKIEEPPPEDMQEVDVDVPIDSPNVTVDNSAPVNNQPMSPQPQAFDAVMTVKSPVILRNIYGSTRNTGTRGSKLARFGGDSMTEDAVLRALRWLKKNQAQDGSWGGQRTAMTGLAVLTFLAHGEKPGDSEEFGPTVQKALEYLIHDQGSDGRFAHMDGNQYALPIATYALCEAYGMTLNPNVKDCAERALVPIIKGQHPTGGWTYKCDPKVGEDGKYRDDTSYMGWCAQAVKAAKLAKIQVEGLDKCAKLAIRGFKKNADPNGGFGYTSPAPGGGLTSVGTLCMMLLGAGDDKDAKNGQKVIDTWVPTFSTMEAFRQLGGGKGNFADTKKAVAEKLSPEEKKFYVASPQYYFYYATQCKFHEGGQHWTRWNKAMKLPYVKAQIVERNAIKDAKGKEQDVGHWENTDSSTDRPVMDTCLAALQLMVYYRYLPTTSKEAVQVEEEIVATSTDKEDITVDSGSL